MSIPVCHSYTPSAGPVRNSSRAGRPTGRPGMTGVRERLSAAEKNLEITPDAEAGFLDLKIGPASGPNESYELREMVAVATVYLDQGMLDDAEELLREVVDAGYSRPDAVELQNRIQVARSSEPVSEIPSPSAHDPAGRHPRVVFTSPLPGVDRLPTAVQRMVRESDADLRAGRLLSALDASLFVIGSYPDFQPMYVRLAEIELARGRRDAAATLAAMLWTNLENSESSQQWLLYPVRLALTPDDTASLVTYARYLLDNPGTATIDPYVPDAISVSLAHAPQTARELARDYFALQPRSDLALRLYIRSSVACGDSAEFVDVVTANVRPDSAPDLLLLRCAIGASRSSVEWLEWLERAVAGLRRDELGCAEFSAALDLVQRMSPPARGQLTIAVANIARGASLAAREAILRWQKVVAARSSDALDRFIAACAVAVAAESLDTSATLDAYVTAVDIVNEPEIRACAAHCRLFPVPVSLESLLAQVLRLAREQGQEAAAIERLRTLRDTFPESLELRDALATLCLESGRIVDGVRELRYIAERCDATGDLHGMVGAMRRISEALPDNPEVKAKIADGFLQRGVLDEAMRELESLGHLQLRRGRRSDAVAAFTRGADVAAAIGNVKRATEFIDHAVLAEPDRDEVRHAAVAFFLRVGAVDRAVQQLWEVVRIALEASDPDEAVAALHQIIALAPGDTAGYHKLGEVLASLGEYAQAEKVYRRLATLTPDDPVLLAKQAALSALSGV
ncbi:MAG: hypothetical protein DCC58_10800 [Chloroflexi bacterium]|nr:MAG: hypothetical protein DCC58_10800 [Chloroflexota bacterium]